MRMKLIYLLLGLASIHSALAQTPDELLSIDRIYSGEFRQGSVRPIQWIEDGDSYLIIEKSSTDPKRDQLVKYDSDSQERTVFISATQLIVDDNSIAIESFTLSPDGSKVLIFTNSSRVWRSNTKGDYYVYDLVNKDLKKLGATFPSSSLMFAKLSTDNTFAIYVHQFNIYKEDLTSGKITQLTFDGSDKIINGTFDWAYEEEFGKRDGTTISPDNRLVAFWNIDASAIGTFFMINNTDSVYSQPIPLQYPKVGRDPSAAKVGVIDLHTMHTIWISVPGNPKQHYIPEIQWINSDLLLIQQLNRHQNKLVIYSYRPSDQHLEDVYIEEEDTWIDLGYPDISSNSWGKNDLPIVDDNTAFLRMTEKGDWRNVRKVTIATKEVQTITPFDFDIASMKVNTKDKLYFIASPDNSTQRYLFETDITGRGKLKRITPEEFAGVNNYNIAPNGKYAVHTHESVAEPKTVRLIKLPSHKTIKLMLDNATYKDQLTTLALPEVKFKDVEITNGYTVEARMILPPNFDSSSTYPVLFHVYGEPWGQVSTDQQIGLWNIMMAQLGYVIIDMDNRGTPCLKGSKWRKSIYRNIGKINASDQAYAAKKILQLPYLDESRTAVWGWSGGGSMTLNLMFKYPEIYTTGIAVAAVADQLIYDNIYQERYMGLPQENIDDFVEGSPVTYAKNLEGNLLLIHGTADDNVHYQSAELLINELIKHNRQFDFMAYPNRSHGIWEGKNTRKHLYTMMTNYILEHVPPNE